MAETEMVSSYELSRRFGMYHSELISEILNLAEVFNNETMKFERVDDSYFLLNTWAAALIIILHEKQED